MQADHREIKSFKTKTLNKPKYTATSLLLILTFSLVSESSFCVGRWGIFYKPMRRSLLSYNLLIVHGLVQHCTSRPAEFKAIVGDIQIIFSGVREQKLKL